MNEQKIKGHCKCGRCTWEAEMRRDGEVWYHWVLSSAYYTTMDDIGELNFCPVCGCRLTGSGFAYEMVRAERVAELKDEALKLDRALDLACWAIWAGSSQTQKEIRRSLESEARYQLARKEAADERAKD